MRAPERDSRGPVLRPGLFRRLLVVLIVPLLSACSSARSLVALSRSTDHFVAFAADDRILFEPGAEPFAGRISPFLNDAVDKVESGHFSPFVDPVRIHVCATTDSFYRLTGQKAPATVTG